MAGMYTKLVSHFLFPIHEYLKGHNSVALMRLMEQSQWWDRDKFRSYQDQRVRRLLLHSYEHVPYYRRIMRRHGIVVADIQGLDGLPRIPFLDKQNVRVNINALKADDARGLARFNTGGSSGEPLIFYIGKERVSHDVAAKWRAMRWWGVDIGDPEIVVWGSPIELGAQDRIRAIRDRLMRTRLLAAFEMSPIKLDRFIGTIRAFRPAMLFGYPSSLALIARHARNKGIVMDDLGVKVAFVTSEQLYEDQRSDIARIFGCRVANGYGGRDAGFIAHECPEGGIHITGEDIVVEIVDQEGNGLPAGKAGEIVVTHLATRDFPFIRYRTGDVGMLSDRVCACGRELPMLGDIQGRTTDFVVAGDGTIMHGLALIYVVRDVPGISKFKIVQESIEHTRVFLVPDSRFEPESIQMIKRGFIDRLGSGVRVDVETVDHIPAESSGKFRYIVSKEKIR